MCAQYLKLSQICEFVKGNFNSRNMVEGEEVLKAGQVLLVGSILKTTEKIEIVGLVLQTSGLTSFPHKIEGVLKIINSNDFEIDRMDCSCKAGLSGSCKHVVAILLYLERNNIMELENMSCTDLKCSWKSQKNSISDHFSAVPINEFCCAKQDDNDENKLPFQYRDLDENLASEILKNLCEAAPESAITLHLAGRGTASLFDNSSTRYSKELINKIIENSLTNNEAIKKLQLDVPIEECCLQILQSLKINDPVDICYNTAMNRKVWLNERKLRISGSRVYDLHTYSKNSNANWQLRAQKFFWPQAIVNKYVKHGLKFENDAREKYSESFEKTVVECGFVVNPIYSWLGYTPDGVIFENENPAKLLEIKCFYKAKDMPVNDCLQEIPYLDKKTGFLKQKHKYYGQIQMGMLILNLNSCDFVVYGSFDKSLYVVNVPFDESFALEMVKNASTVYITKMLHSICLNATKT